MARIGKNSAGFGAVEILLLLLVVGIIAGTGWYVVKARSSADKSLKNAANSSQTTSETDTWYLYESKGGEYKMRLADGLTFSSSDDASPYRSIFTDNLTPQNGPAKVVPPTQAVGKEGGYGLFVNYFVKSSDTSMQGEKQSGFKTQSGLEVEKYYYVQATEPEGIGMAKGGKEYKYRIIKDGKALTVAYDISSTDTSNVELVEKMVKTVVIR